MLGSLNKLSITLIVTTIGLITLPAQAALLVSSSGDNSVKQYDETTGAYIRDFVTAGSGGLSSPQDLAIGPNGNLFVSSQETSSVKEYSGTTGEFIRDFVSADDGLLFPQGLTFGKDGSLFVDTNRIPDIMVGNFTVAGVLQYDRNGELIDSIQIGVAGFSGSPIDLTTGGVNENLFISTSGARDPNGYILQYDIQTRSFLDRLDPNANVFPGTNPIGIVANDEYIWYAKSNNGEIARIDLATTEIDPAFQDSNISPGSFGLTLAADGSLLVSNSFDNSIKKYNSATGDFLGELVTSGSGGLSSPTYITSANVPIPEPSSVLGVVALGGLFLGSALQRQSIRIRRKNNRN